MPREFVGKVGEKVPWFVKFNIGEWVRQPSTGRIGRVISRYGEAELYTIRWLGGYVSDGITACQLEAR